MPFADMNIPEYVNYVVMLLIVLAMIFLLAWLYRHFMGGAPATKAFSRRQRRLNVIEASAIDQKHRLVLVARDNTEHLLLIGGPNDLVVETGIIPPIRRMAPSPKRPFTQPMHEERNEPQITPESETTPPDSDSKNLLDKLKPGHEE